MYSFLTKFALPNPASQMKLSHPLSHYCQLRHYATAYTAKITSTTNLGCQLSAEVSSPSVPSDPRGYPLPRRDLICKISQILTTSPTPLPSLLAFLQTLKPQQSLTLTSSECSLILKSLSKSPSLSLQFFRSCPSQFPGFRHCTFSYNRLLLTLSFNHYNHHYNDIIRDLVAHMDKTGIVGNVSTVNILIGAMGASGIDWCFELAKKWGLRPNSYTYRCALQAYLRAYETEKALEVYMLIRRCGSKLDVIAYNMLLDNLAKKIKFDKAYMVLGDMKRKFCEPDEFTYTIMIRMAGKMQKPDECLALFQEMLSKGICPNLMAYNTMIEALAKNRIVDKSIFLFSKMIENNCRPNEFTYSVILTLLVAEGQLGRLDEVIDLSKKFITKAIYAFLVKTLGKLGHASETHRLFCNMWAFHEKGDREACVSMLESLCNGGKTIEAIDLLNKIHEKGISCDTMMFNIVLSALGRLKQISHLLDLYEKMITDGPSPDIYTYNILISSFGRAGKVDEAIKIFEQLEESDCKPDIVSYNALINCLGKNGDVDEAHMRFQEMQEKGFSPDVVTYSTLIECFGKSDKVEMASRLFDDMVAQGCCPNIVTYNILLDCFERSGKTGEAVDLYAKLKQQGLTPDSITYSILERLQSGSHRPSRVRKQNPITGWIISPLK
ncbi:pentatricopeptide repeat-containing protein At1g51965, mitochondrial [Silene latifolia]|uniref:pentatricopeptide repeat-containing protein At1g51965, mitochondrial n=1 Tax=Silene latifolia TaxID=37657 RepID=UPI003D775EA8